MKVLIQIILKSFLILFLSGCLSGGEIEIQSSTRTCSHFDNNEQFLIYKDNFSAYQNGALVASNCNNWGVYK